MTKQVQRRRGTATQHTSFTGAEGELSVNTTNKSVHVHDNVTAGGFEAARADMDNVTSSSILTAAGITATTTELNYVDGVTSSIQTQLDGKAGTASPTFTGTLTTANLTATGTTTLAGASTSADITFGDNDKAVFGAGSDLQIYHDGSHSYISDQGEGRLRLAASDKIQFYTADLTTKYAEFTASGAAELRYANATKFATTSTGVDITGTLTSDDVSIADTSPTLLFNRTDRATDNKIIRFAHDGEDFQLQLANDAVSSVTPAIAINRTGMTLDSIAFFEDTGTTAKFFWSAADERLGIGTSSPAWQLHVKGTSNAVVQIEGASSAGSFVNFGDPSDTDVGQIGYDHTSNYMRFKTNDTERMRLGSDGTLLVGKTATDSGVVGFEAAQDGHVYVTVNNTLPLYINRQSGAELLRFASNGTTVGNIGSATKSGDTNIFIGNSDGDVGIYFHGATDSIDPVNPGNGFDRNGAIDLGRNGVAFKDLYLSGTIEIENGTGNVVVGKGALSSNTGSNNTAVGHDAGLSNTTSSFSTYVGYVAGENTTGEKNTFLGQGAGSSVTTGADNTIIGRYNGNQGGLDIRTQNNRIVLSDGDGNPELYWNSSAWNFTGPSGAGAITTDGTQFIPTGNKVEQRVYIGTTSARTSISFRNPNGQVGYIQVNSSSVSYSTSSDHRLKENVVELTGATDRLKQLNPSRFNFIADADTTVDGFLAHEVQSVVPEAITGTHNEVDADGNPVYQGIDQSKLVPLLVATIKELEARIAALETN